MDFSSRLNFPGGRIWQPAGCWEQAVTCRITQRLNIPHHELLTVLKMRAIDSWFGELLWGGAVGETADGDVSWSSDSTGLLVYWCLLMFTGLFFQRSNLICFAPPNSAQAKYPVSVHAWWWPMLLVPWHQIFAACVWASPAKSFGQRNDHVAHRCGLSNLSFCFLGAWIIHCHTSFLSSFWTCTSGLSRQGCYWC